MQNRWADSAAEKKRLEDADRPRSTASSGRDVSSRISRMASVRLSPVGDAARARARHAAAERRRLNTLNYGDLLNLTARVLRENADVRRALQQKYRWLFVDEFQDTDPVQAEIMFLLAADETMPPSPQTGASTAPTDWRHAAAASWRALRRRRSEAVDLPLPPRRHRHLQRRARALQRSGDRQGRCR